MDQKEFKKQYKPASCGRAPWAAVIEPHKRDSVMRQIRLECLQLYGYEMDTCPKRGVCIGKSCLGRPLPWKSPTAKPYLDKMKALNMVTNDEYLVSGCDTCPFKTSCTSVCPQINDFMNRHTQKQPELIYQETVDNYPVEFSEEPSEPSLFDGLEIPWSCLGPDREAIVKLRLFKRRDFLSISKQCNLYDQAAAKYEFYAALTKLSEYAILRQFLKEKGKVLTLGQFSILTKRYIDNLDLDSIATNRGTTKQNISQTINRVITKYKLNWPIYVKKQGNKVIYNIPEVLQ